MINVNKLYAGYGGNVVLKSIDLQVSRGTITSIIGANGCGKSTLLKCIARQLPAIGGDIAIENVPINSFSIKELARKISYLKQTRDTPAINVESLVLHGRFPFMGFPRRLTEQDRDIAEAAMMRTDVLKLRHKMLQELSGGECQKVYIAMALTQNADILLLDEPTASLDIKYQLELLALLETLKSEGKTVIAVLHDINSALALSDKICVIDKGEVAFFGEPKQLLHTDIIGDVFDVVTGISHGDTPTLSFRLKAVDGDR